MKGIWARRFATALYAQAHGAKPTARLRPSGLRSHRAAAAFGRPNLRPDLSFTPATQFPYRAEPATVVMR